MNWSRSFKALIVLLALATVIGTLLPSPSVTASPAAQSFSASLEPLAGLVQVLSSGNADWKTVTTVTLLNKGDQVRTGNDGAARVSTVTGIKVEIYPTSLIELKNLALGEGADSTLTFVMGQTSGITYTTLDQPLKKGDSVQVITPSLTANVRGTKFYVFVSRLGNTGFVGEESTFDVQNSRRGILRNQPDNILYAILNVTEGMVTCTVVLLDGTRETLLLKLETQADLRKLDDFLIDFLRSNVNSKITAFLFKFLDLPDNTDVDTLIATIDKFNKKTDIQQFIKDFRSFLRAYFVFISTGQLAPETCGNGKKDDGETATNCATDVTDVSPTTGNSKCETELGESLINDTPDCLPFGDLLKSCTDLLDSILNRGIIIIIKPRGTEEVPVGPTATFTPGPGNPPNPSGN